MYTKIFIFFVVVLKMLSSWFCLSSKKKLIFWVCLEMKLYSTIPLIFLNQGLKQYKTMFVYFVSQSFGSLLIFLYLIFPMKKTLGLMGVFVKLGLFPLFFLMPYVCSNLSWVSMFVVLVLKKIPVFFFLRKKFDFENKFLVMVCLMTIFFCGMAMWSNSGLNMKNFLTWSSVNKSCFLVMLLKKKMGWFTWYFGLYGSLLFFLSVLGSKKNILDSLSIKNLNNFECVLFFLMIFFFSGMPPFLVFFYKMIFLYSTISLMKLSLFGFIVLNFILSFLGYFKFFLMFLSLSKVNYKSKKFLVGFLFLGLLFSSLFLVLV